MAVYRYENNPQPALNGHGRIKDVTAYVNAHPAENLSLAALAAHAETTPSRLVRAFRKILQLTPTAYVTQASVGMSPRAFRKSPR